MSETLASAVPASPVQLFVAIRAAASVMTNTQQPDPVRYNATAERLMHLFKRAEDTGLMSEITDYLNITYRG